MKRDTFSDRTDAYKRGIERDLISLHSTSLTWREIRSSQIQYERYEANERAFEERKRGEANAA